MATQNGKLVQAITLQNRGDWAEAARLFREILADEPGNGAALYSLAVIALNQGNPAEGLAYCERGTRAAPHFAPLWFAQGSLLQTLGRRQEALASYDQALAIQPDYVEALVNSGALLRDLLRHQDALARFDRALALQPDYLPALANSAILLTEFKQGEQAIARFERLLQLNPGYDYGPGLLLYEKMHCADWNGFESARTAIVEGIRAGRKVCKSLAFMALSDSASDQFLCARLFAHYYCPPPGPPLWRGERYAHDRIRLAYVSPDLREHPVGHLMAGVFEHHDKSRFETLAISLGPDDGSRLRGRMVQAFDHFIDARALGARQIAEKMRDMEVDIAVDLAGYTSDARIEIFAQRPAPVQVNFLGYPGTLGVGFMDYILADRHVIPPEHQPFYSERVAYLPDCYLPTDASIAIGPTPTSADCGLPDTGRVFCSFSQDYKISPPLWAVWMRVLAQVPDSVLWLASRGDTNRRNLQAAAQAQGIDPGRLVFAGRVPRVEDHLARYRLADLFLDTWPYNAHSTAADALMAGLPVVTYMGGAFPARVAGSLLHAIGMPELIATSLDGYADLIIELAHAPARIAGLKERLRTERSHWPLFDTAGFCRNLELAYASMLSQGY